MGDHAIASSAAYDDRTVAAPGEPAVPASILARWAASAGERGCIALVPRQVLDSAV